MKFAYADPPYINQAKKHYNCAEINHRELIDHLDKNYDAWALSLSSVTLKDILNMCPEGIRIGAWVKPFCVFKKNVSPAYAWEPIIFKSPRKRRNDIPLVKDFVSCNITMKKGCIGAKPKEFCFWLFEVLGMTPEDQFDDLFHGSGNVKLYHKEWKELYPEVLFRNLNSKSKERFFKRLTPPREG